MVKLKNLVCKKTGIIIALILLVVVALLATANRVTPVEDFEYGVTSYKGETGIKIEAYLGTEKRIVIPNKIKGFPVLAIDKEAFRGTNITKIRLPDTLCVIDEYAFADCDFLTEITLPSGTKRIECAAFSDCDSIKNVKLPDKLEYLGYHAFGDCDSLKELRIPDDFCGFEIQTMPEVVGYTDDFKPIIKYVEQIFNPVTKDDTILIVRPGSVALSYIEQYGQGAIAYEVR